MFYMLDVRHKTGGNKVRMVTRNVEMSRMVGGVCEGNVFVFNNFKMKTPRRLTVIDLQFNQIRVDPTNAERKKYLEDR